METTTTLMAKETGIKPRRHDWAGWNDCLADHAIYAKNCTAIIDGYVGRNRLPADTIETIMLTVNGVVACPFCTALHVDLGRMAGLECGAQLNSAESDAVAVALVSEANDKKHAATFGRVFAHLNGRGAQVDAAYETLVEAVGASKAATMRSLCWFILWGGVTGNTILAAIGQYKKRPGSWRLAFGIPFAMWYAVLFFFVIGATSLFLKIFPGKVPGVLSQMLGCVLWFLASIHFVPLGLVGLLTCRKHASESAEVVAA